MSKTHIPRKLREKVSADARRHCGYWLTREAIVGSPMEIDHLIPEALGGLTEEENLWLACSLIERVERIRVRTVKDNTFELAVTYYRWTLSVALPPRGSEGGVFWDWCWGLILTCLEFSPDFEPRLRVPMGFR
jgi:hypothetical protein